jgi:hypothetical protein
MPTSGFTASNSASVSLCSFSAAMTVRLEVYAPASFESADTSSWVEVQLIADTLIDRHRRRNLDISQFEKFST